MNDKNSDILNKQKEYQQIGKHYRAKDILCPHCGCECPKENLPYDDEQYSHAKYMWMYCESCGKLFDLEVETMRFYTTMRSVCEMEEE